MRIKGEMIMGILDIFKAKPEPIAPVREITKNTRIALAPKNIRNFIDETTYQKPVDADSQLDDTLDPESIAENPFDVIFASVQRNESCMRAMILDPTVFSAVNIIKSAIGGLDARLVFGDKTKDKTKELYEKQFNMLDIYEMAGYFVNGALFGRNIIQFTWKDGYIVQATDNGFVDYLFRNNRELVYAVDGKVLNKSVFFPIVYKQSNYSLYGEPLLASCLESWNKKLLALWLWDKYVEKYGNPLLIGKVKNLPHDISENDANAILENMNEQLQIISQESVGSVIDESVELVINSMGSTNNGSAFQALIDYLDKQISMALLGNPGVNNETPGRLGNGSENQNLLALLLDNIRKFVISNFNDVFKLVGLYNGIPAEEIPIMELSDGQDIDFEIKQSTLDLNLQLLGVKLSEEYLIKNYSDLDSDNFTLTEPAEPEIVENNINPIVNHTKVFDIANKVIAAAKIEDSIEQVKANEQILNDFLTKINTDTGLDSAFYDLKTEVSDLISGYDSNEDLIKDIGNIYDSTGGTAIGDIMAKILTTIDIYGVDTAVKE